MKTNKKLAIKVDNIKKSFQVGDTRVPVLFGINMEIKKGDFVMLVGPSGCGKSTLLHTIYGLEAPSSGKIYIDGNDIWSKTKDWRANFRNRNIGFIPQQAFWIKSLTVIENIIVPAVIGGATFHEYAKRAAQLLELIGMERWADYRPYDLSGGQQQKIALARSLLLNPTFIIADEPTGNLDQKAGKNLLSLLRNINKKFGITILMVTHDINQYKYASRIINMVDGRIVSDAVNKHSIDFLEKINDNNKNEKTIEK